MDRHETRQIYSQVYSIVRYSRFLLQMAWEREWGALHDSRMCYLIEMNGRTLEVFMNPIGGADLVD
jgi:hypothetical protein